MQQAVSGTLEVDHQPISGAEVALLDDTGRTVDASPDEPQYRVRSDKSGGEAVHRPDALRRRS